MSIHGFKAQHSSDNFNNFFYIPQNMFKELYLANWKCLSFVNIKNTNPIRNALRNKQSGLLVIGLNLKIESPENFLNMLPF